MRIIWLIVALAIIGCTSRLAATPTTAPANTAVPSPIAIDEPIPTSTTTPTLSPTPSASPRPTPSPIPTPIPTKTLEERRAAEWLKREITPEGRRLIVRGYVNQRFGELSSLQRERLSWKYDPERLYLRFQIQRFGGFAPADGMPDRVSVDTFRAFLAAGYAEEPNQGALSLQLLNILWALEQPRSNPPSTFLQELGKAFPGDGNAFWASIQPTLISLPPALRAGLLSSMRDEFDNRRAADPLAFISPAEVLREFRGREFIYNPGPAEQFLLFLRFAQGRCGS